VTRHRSLDARAAVGNDAQTPPNCRANVIRPHDVATAPDDALPLRALDALGDPVAIMESNGKVVYANPACRDLAMSLGAGEQGWDGANYLDICPPAQGDPKVAEQLTAALQEVIQGQRDHFEHRFACQARDLQRWFVLHARPLDGELPRRLVLSFQDVTDLESALHRAQASEHQRELGAALHRERELEDMRDLFVRSVSHEFRTPLTILRSALDMVEGGVTDASRIAPLLGRSVRRLDRLLTDLLDLNAMAAGTLRTRREPVALAPRVRALVKDLDTPAAVVLDLDEGTFCLDGGQFDRALDKLLDNAARYGPRKGPIDVTLRMADRVVEVVVADRGPGIGERLREQIFRPFERGELVVGHAPGAGLGLSIASAYAELHGGRAWVEDRAHGGSSFHLSFLAADDRAGTPDRLSA